MVRSHSSFHVAKQGLGITALLAGTLSKRCSCLKISGGLCVVVRWTRLSGGKVVLEINLEGLSGVAS